MRTSSPTKITEVIKGGIAPSRNSRGRPPISRRPRPSSPTPATNSATCPATRATLAGEPAGLDRCTTGGTDSRRQSDETAQDDDRHRGHAGRRCAGRPCRRRVRRRADQRAGGESRASNGPPGFTTATPATTGSSPRSTPTARRQVRPNARARSAATSAKPSGSPGSSMINRSGGSTASTSPPPTASGCRRSPISSGTGDPFDRPGVWHRPADARGLLAVLAECRHPQDR